MDMGHHALVKGVAFMRIRLKRRYLYVSFFTVLFCCLQFIGCTLDPPHEEPSLVDRSVGWEPSVMYHGIVNLLRETDSSFYHSFFFAGSDISMEYPQYVNLKDNASVILETALKSAFHDRYINRGSQKVRMKAWDYYHVAVYLGGETAAVIDTKDGRIVQCVDTRIQPHFSLDSDEIAYITVDLAKLKDDEVKEASTYIVGFSDENMPTPFTDPEDCPLDVTKAFEVSSGNIYMLYSSGRWKHVGDGQYIIYDAEVSNSWLIVGKYFTMLLDKTTGENKFFSPGKNSLDDLSKRQ